jgi:hypothetical protein
MCWLVVACLLSAGQAAAENLRLALDPAWDGRFVAGEETEIGIALSADASGAYLIRVSSANFHVEQQALVEPGQTVTTALPVRPPPDGRLTVDVVGPGGRSVSQAIDLQPTAALFRVRADIDRPLDPSAAAQLQIASQHLPRTLSGYGSVSQVSLDRRAISQLSEAQREALSAYIGRCGALQLAADAQDHLARSLALAGCGKAQFSGGGDVPARHSALVSHDRLRILLDNETSMFGARWVMLAFGFYVLVLVALPRRLRTPHVVSAVAVLASLSIWVYTAWRPPSALGVMVVEVPSGAEQGRVSAVLRLHGDGLKPLSVDLDGRLSAPLALNAGDTSLVFLPEPATHFQIVGTAPLLGWQDYTMHGAAPLMSRPLVNVGTEAVELVNAGPQPIPAGMLTFENRVVATPPLETGARWTADVDAPTLGWTPAIGLLRELALNDRAAWMLPLASTEARTMVPLSRRSAWLLVHPRESAL